MLYLKKKLWEAIIIFVTENHNLKSRKKIRQGEDLAEGRTVHGSLGKLGYTSAFVLPFILQVGFMAATAFFVMHVQVSFFPDNIIIDLHGS